MTATNLTSEVSLVDAVVEIVLHATGVVMEASEYEGRVRVMVTDAGLLDAVDAVAASLRRCGWPVIGVYCQ